MIEVLEGQLRDQVKNKRVQANSPCLCEFISSFNSVEMNE